VVSHDMDFLAENMDRFLLLHQGQLRLDESAQSFFAQETLLERAGLVAPQITRLCQRLGYSQLATNVEQFLEKRRKGIIT
jgi:energy-coupling factor transporter ATP-binding protein EcfA2